MTRAPFAMAGLVLMVGCELKAPIQKAATKAEPLTTSTNVTTGELMRYLSGGEGVFNLDDFHGSVVLLDVCAPWSPISQAKVQEINLFVQQEAFSGVRVIGLVVDAVPAEGMTPELKSWGAAYPLVATSRSQLSHFAQVRSVPARLLVDRKGQVRKQYAGIVSPEILQQDVLALLKEP